MQLATHIVIEPSSVGLWMEQHLTVHDASIAITKRLNAFFESSCYFLERHCDSKLYKDHTFIKIRT